LNILADKSQSRTAVSELHPSSKSHDLSTDALNDRFSELMAANLDDMMSDGQWGVRFALVKVLPALSRSPEGE
jgi:hypothetical protein